MEKVYDMAVKTGEYTTSDGETKGRYENIGSVMKSENGSFCLLKKTFNPAGIQTSDGKDCIIVSLFKPKPKGEAADIPF